MTSISVAMATYNGERFIQEQLASLAAQKHLPHEMVVCDDGSTDRTLEILAEFAKAAPFPIYIHRNPHNLGYADNFFKAASLCQGEWIAFCDQDDIWLPNKLDDVVSALDKDDRPNMVLQNAFLCREDLSHDGRLFPARIRTGYHPPKSQYAFWVWPGFVKTVKANVFRDIPHSNRPKSYFPKEKVQTHDKWTCMIANATGGILVLENPSALYRRHERALTGQYGVQSLSERIEKAMSTAADQYDFLAEVASDTAKYLRQLAIASPACSAADFLSSAGGFDIVAQAQAARAALYTSPNLTSRVRSFVQIAVLGGYIGPSMIAMGWKSGAKDILAAIGAVRKK